jgi:uncharacterized protein
MMDESKLPQNVIVPWDEIEPDTLRNLIQSWIGRHDGTYYGIKPEMTMSEKINIVLRQLEEGTVVVKWNLNLESGDIVLKKDLK